MIYKTFSRLRMAKTALRTPIRLVQSQQDVDVLAPVISPFRVLPHELDMRDHLPNYAFFRFAEMNINKWAYVTGVDNRADYDVWLLAATQVVFLRQIKPLQRFHVKTQVLHWDKKYAYFQHEFLLHYGKKHGKEHGNKNEERAAIVLSKLVFSTQGKQTPPMHILGDMPSTQSEVVNRWLDNQSAMKAHFS